MPCQFFFFFFHFSEKMDNSQNSSTFSIAYGRIRSHFHTILRNSKFWENLILIIIIAVILANILMAILDDVMPPAAP